MPTVLDYIHYPDSFFAFGKSGFDTTNISYWTAVLNNDIKFLFNNVALTANDTNVNGIYNFQNDSLMKENLINNDSIKSVIVPYFKAYKQWLHRSLINNEMNNDKLK